MTKKTLQKIGWSPFNTFIFLVTFIGTMAAAMVPIIESFVEKPVNIKNQASQSPHNLTTQQPTSDALHE